MLTLVLYMYTMVVWCGKWVCEKNNKKFQMTCHIDGDTLSLVPIWNLDKNFWNFKKLTNRTKIGMWLLDRKTLQRLRFLVTIALKGLVVIFYERVNHQK